LILKRAGYKAWTEFGVLQRTGEIWFFRPHSRRRVKFSFPAKMSGFSFLAKSQVPPHFHGMKGVLTSMANILMRRASHK
jgi:hypothetical protein